MPVRNYKLDDNRYNRDHDLFEEEDFYQKITMKNIFIDSKIKKLKFSKDNFDKLEFGEIKDLMNIQDGYEGYLGAYSELEFFAYRYLKINNFYPDLFRIMHIRTDKFLINLFKYKIPHDSYYKSYEDEHGNISINTIVISFNVNGKNDLYLYLDSDEAIFLYNKEYEKDTNSMLHTLIGLVKNCSEPKIVKNKIYVVYQTSHGLDKQGFSIKKININLDENYNDGFLETSREIIEGLNDKKKTNLVILSGEPGVGKTTWIRYLTSKIKKNIIFIAPDMVEQITAPSFIPFLIKNNNAVLIIEDAEPALETRKGNRSSGVSNVLNLTDGLLSDCLNISIVATFNTTGKDIDEALLRKGRLLKHYKFEKLNIKKSKTLLNKLGHKNVDVKFPMTLSEIYFYGKDNSADDFKKNKIGF